MEFIGHGEIYDYEESDDEVVMGNVSDGVVYLSEDDVYAPGGASEEEFEEEADLGHSGHQGQNQHYLVGSSDPPTPEHSYSVCIGKPGLEITPALTKKLLEHLKGICGAGVVAIEKNADGSQHWQCALVFKAPGKPQQFNRNVKRHLGWAYNAGTSKHVQAKAKWTATYTFQNVAGGYCAKEDKNPTIWGIHPQFLLQGKVAYGNFKSDSVKGKEISPYNFVPVLFPLGKRKGAKTLKEVLALALKEGYFFHKCGGRLHMDQLRQDYLRFIKADGQDVDDLWQNMQRFG